MKTAIAFDSKFLAIKSSPVTIDGLHFAIHRTPGKSGWTVTHPRTGVALGKSSVSKAAVIELVRNRIETAGVENVLSKLARLPAAPPVDTLPEYVAQITTKGRPADIDAIIAAIHNTVALTDDEAAAVRRALNSRTGQLKAKAPSAFGDADQQLAAAAWQGLQPNGFKIGIVSVLSLRGPARDLYEKLAAHRWPAILDKDKHVLTKAGAW